MELDPTFEKTRIRPSRKTRIRVRIQQPSRLCLKVQRRIIFEEGQFYYLALRPLFAPCQDGSFPIPLPLSLYRFQPFIPIFP